MNFFNLVVIISSLSFLIYGGLCVTSDNLKLEFKRYGLEKFRLLTGLLEICGGLGLLIGLKFKTILQPAALGLSLMMLAALIVRVKIKDRPLQALPALILFFINLFIFFH